MWNIIPPFLSPQFLNSSQDTLFFEGMAIKKLPCILHSTDSELARGRGGRRQSHLALISHTRLLNWLCTERGGEDYSKAVSDTIVVRRDRLAELNLAPVWKKYLLLVVNIFSQTKNKLNPSTPAFYSFLFLRRRHQHSFFFHPEKSSNFFLHPSIHPKVSWGQKEGKTSILPPLLPIASSVAGAIRGHWAILKNAGGGRNPKNLIWYNGTSTSNITQNNISPLLLEKGMKLVPVNPPFAHLRAGLHTHTL